MFRALFQSSAERDRYAAAMQDAPLKGKLRIKGMTIEIPASAISQFRAAGVWPDAKLEARYSVFNVYDVIALPDALQHRRYCDRLKELRVPYFEEVESDESSERRVIITPFGSTDSVQ